MDLEDVRRAFEARYAEKHMTAAYAHAAFMRRDVEGTADHQDYAVPHVQALWKDWLAATRAALGWAVSETAEHGRWESLDDAYEDWEDMQSRLKQALAALGGDE